MKILLEQWRESVGLFRAFGIEGFGISIKLNMVHIIGLEQSCNSLKLQIDSQTTNC